MISGLSDSQVPSGCFFKVTVVGSVAPSGVTVTLTWSPGFASVGKLIFTEPSS